MRIQYIASGTIIVPAELPLHLRLKAILDNIREVIQTHRPDDSALEKVFVNANPVSTLLLGQARGAAMCALADCNLDVTEYTALQIKKAVVGNGHAKKEQVQLMVQHLLSLNGLPSPDSADALACAICHAHANPMLQKLKSHEESLLSNRARMRAGRLIG